MSAAMMGGQTFVIIGAAETLPSDLDAQVRAAGGSLVASMPEIGVAKAASSSPAFRSKLASVSGVESVTPDMVVQWTQPMVSDLSVDVMDESAVDESAVRAVIDPTLEPLFALQWAQRAIQAPEAWNNATGKGVRVAIVDGGVFSNHPDLRNNLDAKRSISFVPGQPFNFDVDFDPVRGVCVQAGFWHGTHVAGIVGAAANKMGVIGVAPNVTLIAIKVLHCGSGTFEQVVTGIMYAAKPIAEGGAGANVINLSLGAVFDAKSKDTKADAKELKKMIDRAVRYAWDHGVTVVAATGNNGINFDEANELFASPAQNQHVIAVAATGPHGFALGATDFDSPVYFSNVGKSIVELAAPGGTDGLLVERKNNSTCTFAGLSGRCWNFDLVVSTTRTGWGFAAGTSMSAPMVSGVAALIIERSGGLITPAGVRERLRQSSLDLGKPGNDEFYGHGFVNALRAVQ